MLKKQPQRDVPPDCFASYSAKVRNFLIRLACLGKSSHFSVSGSRSLRRGEWIRLAQAGCRPRGRSCSSAGLRRVYPVQCGRGCRVCRGWLRKYIPSIPSRRHNGRATWWRESGFSSQYRRRRCLARLRLCFRFHFSRSLLNACCSFTGFNSFRRYGIIF